MSHVHRGHQRLPTTYPASPWIGSTKNAATFSPCTSKAISRSLILLYLIWCTSPSRSLTVGPTPSRNGPNPFLLSGSLLMLIYTNKARVVRVSADRRDNEYGTVACKRGKRKTHYSKGPPMEVSLRTQHNRLPFRDSLSYIRPFAGQFDALKQQDPIGVVRSAPIYTSHSQILTVSTASAPVFIGRT